MVLCIDIGNTNIEVGGVSSDGICFQERMSTEIDRTELEYAILLNSALRIHKVNPDEIEGSIISSVVPPLVHIMKDAVSCSVSRP